jgi:anti-sigma factor RsiW
MSRFGKRIGQTEHQYVAERLSAYLDGELPPSERSVVEHHVGACQSCQWDLATLRQSVQWTRELPTIPLPRAFTIPAPAQPRRAARRRWTFLPLLQGATALVALLLFFVVAGDVMFTGLLPSFAPRPLDQQEQAVPAVAATQVVEEALKVEAAVESDETRAAELTPAPAAEVTWPQPATPTRQLRLTRTLGLSSTPGITVVITGALAIEIRPTLAAPSLAVEDPTASAAVEPTLATAPTPAPEPTYGDAEPVVEAEPVPTAIVPAPSPKLPAEAAPTTLARVEEPVRPVPVEQEQRGLLSLQVPAVAWLRVTEAVLATTLVLLGVTTIVIMLLQRKAR